MNLASRYPLPALNYTYRYRAASLLKAALVSSVLLCSIKGKQEDHLKDTELKILILTLMLVHTKVRNVSYLKYRK